MKRVNIVFTALNILVVITMLGQICYEYSIPHSSTPPEVALYIAFLYIFPLILINGIWLLIRLIRGKATAQTPVQNAANERGDGAGRLRRVNIIFAALNIILSAAIILNTVIYTLREGGSAVLNLMSVLLYYGVPAVLINDAWVVASANMKSNF